MSEIIRGESWRPWRTEWYIHRGEDFDLNLQFIELDDDGNEVGPYDYTGYTGETYLIPHEEDAAPVVLTTVNGKMALDDQGNKSWLLTDEETEALAWKSGTVKIYLTDSTGKRRLDGRGTVSVD